jgi:hypothetical protein
LLNVFGAVHFFTCRVIASARASREDPPTAHKRPLIQSEEKPDEDRQRNRRALSCGLE